MKYIYIFLVVLLILVPTFVFNNFCFPSSDFLNYSLSRVKIGNKNYCLYLADTNEKRTNGLSNKTISSSEGMIFIYKQPGYRRFWMKEMSYSLDLLYLNNNRVIDYHENIAPDTYPKTFTSSTPANKIIELKAGEIKNASIKKGDVLNFQ